ncbi:hypothetical protein OF83DRAFT_1171381 [Amylostereum chailletii]|nr:hypothetical protein OF83DRAFT_1171381 [Amylostereum chailletii]
MPQSPAFNSSTSSAVASSSPSKLRSSSNIICSYKDELVVSALAATYEDAIDQLQLIYSPLKTVPRENIHIHIDDIRRGQHTNARKMVRIAPTLEAWRILCKGFVALQILTVSVSEEAQDTPPYDARPSVATIGASIMKDDGKLGVPVMNVPARPRSP